MEKAGVHQQLGAERDLGSIARQRGWSRPRDSPRRSCRRSRRVRGRDRVARLERGASGLRRGSPRAGSGNRCSGASRYRTDATAQGVSAARRRQAGSAAARGVEHPGLPPARHRRVTPPSTVDGTRGSGPGPAGRACRERRSRLSARAARGPAARASATVSSWSGRPPEAIHARRSSSTCGCNASVAHAPASPTAQRLERPRAAERSRRHQAALRSRGAPRVRSSRARRRRRERRAGSDRAGPRRRRSTRRRRRTSRRMPAAMDRTPHRVRCRRRGTRQVRARHPCGLGQRSPPRPHRGRRSDGSMQPGRRSPRRDRHRRTCGGSRRPGHALRPDSTSRPSRRKALLDPVPERAPTARRLPVAAPAHHSPRRKASASLTKVIASGARPSCLRTTIGDPRRTGRRACALSMRHRSRSRAPGSGEAERLEFSGDVLDREDDLLDERVTTHVLRQREPHPGPQPEPARGRRDRR